MAFFDLDGQHGPGRAVPEADRHATCWRTAREDMEFFNQRIDKTRARTPQQDHRRRLRSRCATPRRSSILENCGESFEFPVAWGTDLQSEHERFLTEKHFKLPGDPARLPAHDQAVLHARATTTGETVRAMDVLVPEVGEIIGGSQREERLDVLERAHDGAGPRPGQTTGGTATCAATAPCPTPASAWAWSGWCSSSPAWPTSAT